MVVRIMAINYVNIKHVPRRDVKLDRQVKTIILNDWLCFTCFRLEGGGVLWTERWRYILKWFLDRQCSHRQTHTFGFDLNSFQTTIFLYGPQAQLQNWHRQPTYNFFRACPCLQFLIIILKLNNSVSTKFFEKKNKF